MSGDARTDQNESPVPAATGNGAEVQISASIFSAAEPSRQVVISPALVPSCNAVDEFMACCMKVPGKTDPLPNFANVKLAFDLLFPGLFRLDEMARQVLLMRPIVDCEDFEPRPLRDVDASHLQELLQKTVLPRIGLPVVYQAIDAQAHANAFHPVREYLDALVWNGQSCLEQLFPAYFGTEDSPYTRQVACMFMVSAVARIYQPGCKADHMVVLEGKQGVMKSTACAILGGEWFSDTLPNVGSYDKDVSGHLRGKWILEVPELSALSKTESASLKSFISRNAEIYRPPYGRNEVYEPRQCVFIGTTNSDSYLKDETGGRRFWPIRVLRRGERQYNGLGHPDAIAVGHILVDELRADRDQLFAEAVHLYRMGYQWWPDHDFEEQHIVPQQAARFELDAWEPLILNWLQQRAQPLPGMNLPPTFALADLAKAALDINPKELGTILQRRITKILTNLGCEKARDPSSGRRLWTTPKAGL
jgi:predicted P-loop ATPase